MVRRIREIGTDLKDLVTLTVVLSVCRGGTVSGVQKRALEGLQAIIDTGLQSMQTSHEAISSLPVSKNFPCLHPPAPSNVFPNVRIKSFILVCRKKFSRWLTSGNLDRPTADTYVLGKYPDTPGLRQPCPTFHIERRAS